MNMHLEVDGVRVEQNNVDDFQQHVNMKRAEFITTFSVKNKVNVIHKLVRSATFLILQ